ncbi:MAG: cation:H+ antiporter [Kiritimatiellia bacterium]
MDLLILIVGLLLLVGGAELLVRGGGKLALAFRVPALIVGLTVVSFGTSSPEAAVSISAALSGSTEAALANVTGSNIANILLVLGIASLVRPLPVDRSLIKRELPALVILQLLVPVFCIDEQVVWWEGLILLALGVTYTGLLVRSALKERRESADIPVEKAEGWMSHWGVQVAMVAVGIVVLVGGAQIFVHAAFSIATYAGFSDRFIGLTVIALGTSAPEIVTGAVSAWRGEVELALGNSIGSNILNISMVLAITSLIRPVGFTDPNTWIDLMVANGCALLLAFTVLASGRIGRVAGAGMIVMYLAYIGLAA